MREEFRVLTELATIASMILSCAPEPPALLALDSLCGMEAADELTLSARLDGQTSGLGPAYMAANGMLFFYVMGNCDYWVNDGSWVTHHGSLGDADLQLVDAALKYRQLPRLVGQWRARSCYDSSFLRVQASEGEIMCQCNCDAPDTPVRVREIESGFRQFVRTMAGRSSPWMGSLEILVVEDDSLQDQPLVAWPLNQDIERFAVTSAELRGRLENNQQLAGIVVDAPEDALLIRQVMLDFAREHPDKVALGDPLPVSASGASFALYARDLLPVMPATP